MPPLIAPQNPPIAIPSKRASGKTSFISRSESDRAGSTFFTKMAMQTVTSATVEPTERSIPPAIMMIVMPRAAMPTITVCTAIVRQLSTVRKVPDCRVSVSEEQDDQEQPDERAEDRPGPAQAAAQLDRPPIPCRFPSGLAATCNRPPGSLGMIAPR